MWKKRHPGQQLTKTAACLSLIFSVTAQGQVLKSRWIIFCHHSSKGQYPEEKETLIPSAFLRRNHWFLLPSVRVPVNSCACTHTQRLLAPPFDHICISHWYLDPIRLQKPPEAHFVQSSCVGHSTIPSYRVSQCKNLSFVAGICQSFSISRWRRNRSKVHWSGIERKTEELVKTRQVWIPIWQKDRNGIDMKAFSVQKQTHLWICPEFAIRD